MNTVIICPDLKSRNALIRAIAAAGGPKPGLKSNSVSAQRAHYAPELANYIINTASEQMFKVLGYHNTAISVPVSDARASAEIAETVFRDAGFEAQAHHDIEPEFPAGFLSFVKVPALGGTVLLFGPTPEIVKAMKPEILATMPKREIWMETDASTQPA